MAAQYTGYRLGPIKEADSFEKTLPWKDKIILRRNCIVSKWSCYRKVCFGLFLEWTEPETIPVWLLHFDQIK